MRKVKWGVLGTADIAKGCVIPALMAIESVELVAIAGRSMDKANAFKEEFGFIKAYGSYDELLLDDEIEAIYIPLPNGLHKEWTVKCAKAKKHVLCEKPIACTVEEMQEIITACEENGVLFMEAFPFLHSPMVSELKKHIGSERLGAVSVIESKFYIANRTPEDVRMSRELVGGAMYDLGCYCSSMILTLLDCEMPESIKAVSHMTESGVDDFTVAHLGFSNRKSAVISCGMNCDTRMAGVKIMCEKGFIESIMRFNGSGELQYEICIDDLRETNTVYAENNYILECEQFNNCIINGDKPKVTAEFSMLNAKVIEEILKSSGYYNN